MFEGRLFCSLALAVTTASFARVTFADSTDSRAEIAELHARASRALSDGDFAAANRLYRSILERDPEDRAALREGGRTAHALREFTAAVTLLEKAAHGLSKRDPELHYLLAEALWALGRKSDARAAYSAAKLAIGVAPSDRMPRLWLARIHDRFGNRIAACAIYDALTSEDPSDAEAALTHAEMHAGAREWASAERPLTRLLAVQPGHRRALEMLAWIVEARGDLARELALREELARDSKTAGPVHDLGRALERAGDWAGALFMYRRAAELDGGAGDPMLSRALDRMARRMSIEVAAGVGARSDTLANAIGGFTGVALPFGRAHHVALGAWREAVSQGSREGSVGKLSGSVVLNWTNTDVIGGIELGMIGFTGRDRDAMWSRTVVAPGAHASTRRSLLGRHVVLGLDGELNSIWRETPGVELEGGRVDALTAHLWGNALGHRLVLEGGAQLRAMRFVPDDAMGDPSASQTRVWAGADWQLWGDPSQQALGEILDEDLLRPSFLASAVVASYRHHEVFSTANTAFMNRLVLAERASVDELVVALRLATYEGRLAIDARGGVAYDRARSQWIASGAAGMWAAVSARARVALELDFATEGRFAIGGQRIGGGMTFHVDL